MKVLCTEKCEPQEVNALMVSCLAPLDKNLGLRPVVVDEVLRRIIGKVVMVTSHKEITDSVGSLPVCTEHKGCCEAAVHAMRSVLGREDSKTVLIIDVVNALNSVNRKVFLHNISIICPFLSHYVYN